MMSVFPLNYFSTAFSARKIFINRDYLKHWQKILIILVLNSLLMLPLSLQLGRLTNEDLTHYTPQAMNFIDQSVVESLRLLENSGLTLEIHELSVIKEEEEKLIALAPTLTEAVDLLNGRIGVVYTPDEFILAEEGEAVFYQPYTLEPALNQLSNVDELKELMSQQWFWSNRTSIIITNFIYITILVLTSLLLLILGASFILSLMNRMEAFDIQSYNQALTIVLNCLGLPTLIAMIVGLVSTTPTTMLTVQGLLFVLMLIWVYWKTHFNDEYVANSNSKEVKTTEN
ncbi:hypothetical protein ACF3NG_07885 [Aerococcaceae bacterium WGS1372]